MKAISFSIISFFLFITPISSQNNCPADAPSGYNVEYSGPDCFLTFTWPTNEMPAIACGSPGSPALGSGSLKGDLFDLTLNGSAAVYDRGSGNSCNGAITNLAYHSTLADTYITTSSHCDLAVLSSTQFQANRSNGSNFDCEIINLSQQLPVEYISFFGKEENRQITLHWRTASELNNSHFELEKSSDGRVFKMIGAEQGAGSSNQETTYRFIDQSPYSGTNYYRLKQVDFSGHFDYSKTIMVRTETANYASFYPTNVYSDGTLNYGTEQEGVITTTIVDLLGRKIKSQEFYASAGSNFFIIETKILRSGSYLLIVEGVYNELTTLHFSKIR